MSIINFFEGVIMLRKSLFILSLFTAIMFGSTHPSIAGRLSKLDRDWDFGLEAAELKYSNALKMHEEHATLDTIYPGFLPRP